MIFFSILLVFVICCSYSTTLTFAWVSTSSIVRTPILTSRIHQQQQQQQQQQQHSHVPPQRIPVAGQKQQQFRVPAVEGRLYQSSSSSSSSEYDYENNENENGNDKNENDITTANEKEELERQKENAEQMLEQISALKNVILIESPTIDDNNNNNNNITDSNNKLNNNDKSVDNNNNNNNFQYQVQEIEKQVTKLELSSSLLIPPNGLSIQEYKNAIILFLQTPFIIRYAFCKALLDEIQQLDSDLDNNNRDNNNRDNNDKYIKLKQEETPQTLACNLQLIPDIITVLYEQRIQLTTSKLQNALKRVQKQRQEQSAALRSSTTNTMDASSMSSNNRNNDDNNINNNNNNNIFGFPGTLFDNIYNDTTDSNKVQLTEDELRIENTVKAVLGRVTRKENMDVTKNDFDTVIRILNKEKLFTISSTDKIPGGYIIRGQPKQQQQQQQQKTAGSKLIKTIDKKLPQQNFNAQVHYTYDVTVADVESEPVLIVLNKDMTPQISSILTTICSFVATISAFIFCVSAYGSNDIVAQRLSEATAINDADEISWFTNKVYESLTPMFIIQLVHEIGHYIIAKGNQMKMGIPTLLPFWTLPFMGAKTDLITSPPNRNALFDFGIVGPFLGILASFGCLAWGLSLTATADAATMQYFPSLSVSQLQTSTLGGSMVDFFLGGGIVGAENRFITMQDPTTPIPVHPFAIAGFASLLINSLALLPLGSTDGGRMSTAIFGRFGHTIIGALVWVTILIASFGLERADILIGAWLVNNFVQNDMEIPCRDEVEDVSLTRVLAAMSLWFLAVLAITPLSQQ